MSDDIDHARRDLLGAAATVGLLAAAPVATATVSRAETMRAIPACHSSESLKRLCFNLTKKALLS